MNNALSKEFDNRCWSLSKKVLRLGLLGDESTFAQMVRKAPTIGYDRAGRHFRAFLESPAKARAFELIYSKENGGGERAEKQLRGLCTALEVAEIGFAGNSENIDGRLKTVIKTFSQLWDCRSTASRTITLEDGFGQKLEPNLEVFKQLRLFEGVDLVGYWVIYDLLARWFEVEPESKFKATANVLAISKSDVRGLLDLTIELFPCKNGPFCPDPQFLGLTTLDNGLLVSIENMWQYSGLSNRFRGRWKLTNPSRSEDQLVDVQRVFPPVYRGRSAEAMFLVTMLAASGDPYQALPVAAPSGDPMYAESPEPMNVDVVITATVEKSEHQNVESVLDYRLGDVGDTAKKLNQAFGERLRSVALSKPEFDSSQKGYPNIRIEKLATVRDAVDYTLVSSRILKTIQRKTKFEWRDRWDRDSGRHSNDDEDLDDLVRHLDVKVR